MDPGIGRGAGRGGFLFHLVMARDPCSLQKGEESW